MYNPVRKQKHGALAVSLRRRTTNPVAAIAGSIAEGFYGVPEKLKSVCRNRLPKQLLPVLDRFDAQIKEAE